MTMGLKERHEKMQKLSVYWWNKANDLHASALVLWHFGCDKSAGKLPYEKLGIGPGFSLPIATDGVFKMLAGLSLELLLKASTVRRDRSIENLNMKSHDLLVHAGNADFALTPSTRAFLQAISVYIQWLGRYPMAKTLKLTEQSSQSLDKTRILVRLGKVSYSEEDPTRTLSLENYLATWTITLEHFYSFPAGPGDVGYQLKGHE
jgi:hypothetical protein